MVKEILQNITSELEACFAALDEVQIQNLEEEIRRADRVFVAGTGRSLMMIRGLAMRLMHMGYTSYVVGETVTPAIREGDLLIIASGSGETASMAAMADKCRRIGARLALLTTAPSSTIGRMADLIVHIPAVTPKRAEDGNQNGSVQPGANTFEQSVLLIGDAIIIDLVSGKDLEAVNRQLMALHANLE